MTDMLEMFLDQANMLAAKTGTDPYTGLKLGQVGDFLLQPAHSRSQTGHLAVKFVPGCLS